MLLATSVDDAKTAFMRSACVNQWPEGWTVELHQA